ncbi:MAG: hypothetical protein DRJ97_07815 [Thermoprotei archaeon]|nr:MAG: hypothetical protein DRJ97_07815 [Thermoprotei archaeon]
MFYHSFATFIKWYKASFDSAVGMINQSRGGGLSNGENALNALDLIINVLKDHEKELDKLVNELKGLVQKLSLLEGLVRKVEDIDRRLSIAEPVTRVVEPVKPVVEAEKPPTPAPYGPPSTLRFKSWEEFREMASGGEVVSYVVREEDEEQVLEVEVLKGRLLLVYSGSVPEVKSLIKSWLSRELEVPKTNVFEGSIRTSGG